MTRPDRNALGWALVWLGLACTAGCAAQTKDLVCEPDASVPCTGPDGCAGLQRCRHDGQGFYGECQCGGGDVVQICSPGEWTPCRGDDQCPARQRCNDLGTGFGPCVCLSDLDDGPADAAEPDVQEPPDVPPETVEDAPPIEDAGPDLPPPRQEPRARILYDHRSTPIEGFFPWDLHLDPDGAIRVDEADRSNANLPLMAEGPYPPRLAVVHGFATYAPIAFQASVPLDPSSLPGSLEDSVAPDASVRLYALDDAGRPATRVPFLSAWLPYPDDEAWVVRLLPARPLPGKRYLVAVTGALKAADGTPLEPANGFLHVLGTEPIPADTPPSRRTLIEEERARILPALQALPDRESVVAAATFTTAHAFRDGEELRELFARFLRDTDRPPVTWDVDLDDDGQPDLIRDGRLDDCPMPADRMPLALKGIFHPWNLTGEDGIWHRRPDGTFEEFPPDRVDFRLMVPAGSGPFPVVMVQHGIASSQRAMCIIARELVEQGIAVLRFDWPRHGSRGKGTEPLSWGYAFLPVDDPLKIRENFRQAALDVASATLLLDGLAGDPALFPPEGPGLDVREVGYVGHSLGSIIGLLALPFVPRISAFVCNVGGIGLFHLVDLYVQRAFGDVFLAHGYLNSAEHGIWAGDAIAYADALWDGYFRPEGNRVRMLVQEVIDDDTVSNASTETLARAMDLTLVGPEYRPIPGILPSAGEPPESGICQFEPAVHGDFLNTNGADGHRMRDQAIHWMATFFHQGRAEIRIPE
ncbi:hypothetical protein KBD49_07455 [Myxococcota bacterium]|nr:hypothetical protein [Myxococcota bacterium]